MNTFRIQEFAKLAGVTVRALHHYDRLGLLSPVHRSDSGYRLYGHEDLGRLERVLVLRYLGLSLREIGAFLAQPGRTAAESLSATLSRQHAALRERRSGLDRILSAIEHAQARANAAEPDWLLFQIILKEIQMQEAQNWTDRYYSPEGLKALRERREAITPEQQVEIGTKWQLLYHDLQDALDRGVSPDSDQGRAFVARWLRIADEFSLGNSEIGEGFRRLYEDENHWPEDDTAAKLRQQMPKAEYRAFFRAAVHACLRHG